MHPHFASALAHQHGCDLRAAAEAHRLGRSCRRAAPRRIPVAARLYSRLWWAARPRAATWAPTLLPTP